MVPGRISRAVWLCDLTLRSTVHSRACGQGFWSCLILSAIKAAPFKPYTTHISTVSTWKSNVNFLYGRGCDDRRWAIWLEWDFFVVVANSTDWLLSRAMFESSQVWALQTGNCWAYHLLRVKNGQTHTVSHRRALLSCGGFNLDFLSDNSLVCVCVLFPLFLWQQ